MGFIRKMMDKWSCCHDWEVIKDINVYVDYGYGRDDLPEYHKLLMVCRKCGKFKKMKY